VSNLASLTDAHATSELDIIFFSSSHSI